MKFRTLLLSIPLFAGGCATSSGSPDFCAVYRPVPTLGCGSEAQNLAVDGNNAVYMTMCLRRGGG